MAIVRFYCDIKISDIASDSDDEEIIEKAKLLFGYDIEDKTIYVDTLEYEIVER